MTLARHFHRFAACDDGELAEGYSQAVVELLSRHWDRLPELTRLARRDGKLRTWVLRHIDASASGDDLKAIVQNTARCPASTTALCADVRAAAEHALKELEGVDSSE